MKPNAPLKAGPFLFLIPFLFSFIFNGLQVSAQEIHGFRILAIPNGITLLKFRDNIEKWDFAKSDLFTVNVDDGVKLRVLCLVNTPASTQMSVTEGSRTHVFNIEIKTQNVDINTFNGFYDYSDLKALKKLIAAGASAAKPNLTASELPLTAAAPAAKVVVAKATPKPTKAEKAKAEKERKQKEKEDAALAKKEKEDAVKREQEFAKQQAAEQAKAQAIVEEKQRAKLDADKKVAEAAAEKVRLKEEKIAREKAAKEEQAKKEQLEEDNKKAAKLAKAREAEAAKEQKQQEQAQKEAVAKREKEIAKAKEADKQALITKAALAKAAEEKRQAEAAEKLAKQKQREAVAAEARNNELAAQKKAQEAAAKQRANEEAKARKEEAAIDAERKKQEVIARKKQEEIVKEQQRTEALAAKQEQDRKDREAQEAEKVRLREERVFKAKQDAEIAAVKAQERRDALITNPYWKTEAHKKYPDINFAEIPPGQMITGEFFLPKDTLANNAVARDILNKDAQMNRKSDAVKGVTMVMEGISYSGVNTFYRIRVINKSKDDFLIGKMMISWWKKEGGNFYLIPCYITEFPIVKPGEEATIVYGCRGVNATDKDDFLFSLKERRNEEQELQIYFTGGLYNKELQKK